MHYIMFRSNLAFSLITNWLCIKNGQITVNTVFWRIGLTKHFRINNTKCISNDRTGQEIVNVRKKENKDIATFLHQTMFWLYVFSLCILQTFQSK